MYQHNAKRCGVMLLLTSLSATPGCLINSHTEKVVDSDVPRRAVQFESDHRRAIVLTPDSDDVGIGQWQAKPEAFTSGGSCHITVMRSGGSMAHYVASPDRDRVRKTDEGYRISSMAGSLVLKQDAEGDLTGRYELATDGQVRSRQPRITGDLSQDDLLLLVIVGVDEPYLDALTEDHHTVTWRQVAQLRQSNVSPEYFRAIRRARSTPAQVPAPLAEAPVPGLVPGPLPQFTTDDIVRLSSYSVPVAYIQQLQAAGYRFDAPQLIKLCSYNVPVEYAVQLRAAGLDYSVEDLIKLRSYNVPADYAIDLRRAGFDFSIEQMIKLRSYNVPNAYLIALHVAGYRFTIEELIKLRSHNVTHEYALAMLSPHHEPLSAEQLIRLKSHNVDSALVSALRTQTAPATSP